MRLREFFLVLYAQDLEICETFSSPDVMRFILQAHRIVMTLLHLRHRAVLWALCEYVKSLKERSLFGARLSEAR